MNPNKKWFLEYENYNGGDFILGDDSPTKIIGYGKVKLLAKDGRIKTLPSVLQIPNLAKNLISVSTMSDMGVNIILKKYKCKMFQGEMVLMREVRCGT